MKSTFKFLFLFISVLFIITSCEKEDPTYALTVTVSPENAGVVSGAGVYKAGEVVNLTATANEGYLFINWTIGDTEISTEPNFTYTTTGEELTLTANFEEKIIVTLGAQSNTTIGAFYSIDLDQVYNQAAAFEVQDTIDLLCFYEHDEINNRINDITLSSPGANITGIFGGTETDPMNWTIKNLTIFTPPAPAITTTEFDQLHQNDPAIIEYFDETVVSGNKKAKLLVVDNIYAFKTHDNIYGLFKVISVTQEATGSVQFELKLAKQ